MSEQEIDEMADDGRLGALARELAIAAGNDWPSLNGEEQDAWHEAAIAKLRAESEPRKKRRKGTSPTARSLTELKRRGWTAGVVERHSPFPKPQGTKHDLFGVIDLVAIAPILPGQPATWPKVLVGIQATSATNHSHRRDKIIAEPRMVEWLQTGAQLELWSWSQRVRGKAKRWTLRVERFEVRDGRLVGIEDGAPAPTATRVPCPLHGGTLAEEGCEP